MAEIATAAEESMPELRNMVGYSRRPPHGDRCVEDIHVYYKGDGPIQITILDGFRLSLYRNDFLEQFRAALNDPLVFLDIIDESFLS